MGNTGWGEYFLWTLRKICIRVSKKLEKSYYLVLIKCCKNLITVRMAIADLRIYISVDSANLTTF